VIRTAVVALALVAAGALAGCDPAPSTTPSPASTPTVVAASASPSVTGSSSSSGTTGGVTAPSGIPADHWAALLADLERRQVPTTALEVVTAKAVTWPNGSLGCPRPGTSYTQALIDGYQVVVKAGGTTYDYRFGSSSTPRLCEL
jgi:hypothetical protein